MSEVIALGDILIQVTRKDIKNVHLTVHPPNGRVTLVAPTNSRLDIVRAYAISKLGWIKQQQEQFQGQAREAPRKFIERETHYVWGMHRLLTIVEDDVKPYVTLDHKRIILHLRPGSSMEKRAKLIHEWHKSLLHDLIPQLIAKWEPKLGVKVSAYYLQKMKD